jgi:hypothetical protein
VTVEETAAIQERLDRLDRGRENLLAAVAGLPAGSLEWRPSPESWSPAQVVQHLCLVDELTLRQLERPLPPERARRTLRHRVGALVVRVVFTVGIRVRMPTRRVAPEPPLPLETTAPRWRAAGVRLRERAGELSRETGPVMVHPVAGPMTLAQGLDFLLVHLDHHGRQLRRITGSPGFPSPSHDG